jgi:hypothetical protein
MNIEQHFQNVFAFFEKPPGDGVEEQIAILAEMEEFKHFITTADPAPEIPDSIFQNMNPELKQMFAMGFSLLLGLTISQEVQRKLAEKE